MEYEEQLMLMRRAHHRRRVAEMQLFLRYDLPVLLDGQPPKTEPPTPQPDLEMVNPYVPLAHRK